MRIDLYLYKNGFCLSRNKAKQLISEGSVYIDSKVVTKPSFEVSCAMNVELKESCISKYVGRGALKLEHALIKFKVDAKDKICADIGASTGGFTQVLLNNGAKKVYAIDSGTNQLADILKNNDRVENHENTNARYLEKSLFDELPSLIVMDVSFISQTAIYPAILNIANKPCDIITLVKPQFETNSKSALGKHGVIKDEKTRKKALDSVVECARQSGFKVVGICNSPITGSSGNIEYLMHLRIE